MSQVNLVSMRGKSLSYLFLRKKGAFIVMQISDERIIGKKDCVYFSDCQEFPKILKVNLLKHHNAPSLLLICSLISKYGSISICP